MKNTDYIFKTELTQQEREMCLELYGAQEFVSIEQHPDWDAITTTKEKSSYFLMKKENKLISYAILHTPQSKVAHIPFGPISDSKEVAVEALNVILEHFKREKFYYLTIQLPGPVSKFSEFTEYRINKFHKIKYFFDKRNWSTSVIDLGQDIETIIKGFSTNHRRSVKKAKKLGVTARVIDTDTEIANFNDIYVKMYEARGRKIDSEKNLSTYLKALEFFKDEVNGFFFGAFDEEKMLGGFIILIQGNTAFYYHAATDPEQRKIPMQHGAIVSVLEFLKNRGVKYFDFGGYNHLVGEDDQIYHINRFKDGFTKDYIFYPKLMYVEFVPMSIRALKLFQGFKNIIKKIIGR